MILTLNLLYSNTEKRYKIDGESCSFIVIKTNIGLGFKAKHLFKFFRGYYDLLLFNKS